MIYNLIYDPTKKFGSIWCYTFEVINFLIFKDFSGSFSFFLHFYGFILNLFQFQAITKFSYLSCIDVADDVDSVTWTSYTCVHICVLIKWLSILLRI